MKIIFAGTPDFSVLTLSALLQSDHDVVAVLTQPDKPKGRGRKLAMSPVKVVAQSHNIPVLQPSSLKDDEIQSTLRSYSADMMIVIAYGLLLPKNILDMFPYGCINIHASLLPKYRGASPIQSAILKGDTETGVTIMQMDVGMDTGDMLHVSKCKITSKDTAKTLHDNLAKLGSEALLDTFTMIEKGAVIPEKQDDKQATHASKIKKVDAKIDWDQAVETIDREIRAYYGWPVSFTSLNGEVIRVWEASISNNAFKGAPGEIVESSRQGVTIACGQGALTLNKIQLPGGRAVSIQDCLNANADRFQLGKVLGT